MFLNLVKQILHLMGLKIIKENNYFSLRKELSNVPKFVKLWNMLDDQKKIFISPYLHLSMSQFAQDLFVISQMESSTLSKYFIEFCGSSKNKYDLAIVL